MPEKTGQRATVGLSIICRNPPPDAHNGVATEFGLQDKQHRLAPGVRLPDGSLRYEFDVQARNNADGDAPRFSGPYIHGTAATPFLYLSLRIVGAEPPAWINRLKVPLTGLAWSDIREARAVPGGRLEAAVDGAAAATVALLGEGWVLRASGDL